MSTLNTAEDFLTLVNNLVQYILAHHKLTSLPQAPEDSLPPFLADAEKYLVRITNPYTPSEETTTASRQNARQWVAATLTLLRDHYRRIRDRVIGDITPLLVPAWNRALLVATRQARRKNPAISDTTIDATRSMLTAIMSPSFPLPPPAPPGTQFPLPGPSQQPQLPNEPLEEQTLGSSALDAADVLTGTLSTPPTGTTDSHATRPPLPLSPVISIIPPNPATSHDTLARTDSSSPPPVGPDAKKTRFDIDSLDEGYLRSLLDDFPLEGPPQASTSVHPSTSDTTPAPPKPAG